MDPQWYYENAVNPVTGMDSHDNLDVRVDATEVDDDISGGGNNNNNVPGSRRRPRATKLVTVPHPNNKNLKCIYEVEDDGRLPPEQVERRVRDDGGGGGGGGTATDDGVLGGRFALPKGGGGGRGKKQGSPPKKHRTETPSGGIKQANSVLEIENRVLRDMLSRQAPPPPPSTPTPPLSSSQGQTSQQRQQQQQQASADTIGAAGFTTVPSFGTNTRERAQQQQQPSPPSFYDETQGQTYDVSGNPKQPTNVFLYDWFTGTPYDKFDFDTLKRHLVRKAAMLADPVIKFVANVAPLCGTSLQQLVVSNVVHEKATSVHELLDKSSLSQDLLGVLLAVVLNEMLGGGGAGGGNVVVNDSSVKVGKGDDDDDGLVPLSPPFVKKEEPRYDDPGESETVNSSIFDEVRNAKDMLQRHSIGHPLPCQRESSVGGGYGGGGGGAPDLIGLDGFRSLVHGPPVPGFNPILVDLMNILDYSARASNITRWNWNNLPENVGMAMIKPEVVAMIETVYEEIRALGPVQAEFTLKHLMTSPRIRNEFAMMVATAINIIPSELQYPGVSSTRGNGSISDKRVTSGAIREFRATLVYRAKKLYFQRVSYAESSAWKDAQKKVHDMNKTLETLHAQMWTAIREFKHVLGADSREHDLGKESLAQHLGLLESGTLYHAVLMSAYETLQACYRSKSRVDRVVKQLISLDMNDASYADKRRSAEEELQRATSDHEYDKNNLTTAWKEFNKIVDTIIDEQGRQNPWKKHFATKLSIVVLPFLTYSELNTDLAGFQVRIPLHVGVLNSARVDMEDVETKISALLEALKRDMVGVIGWEDNREASAFLRNMLSITAVCLRTIRTYRSALAQHTNALADLSVMSDDDKVELVYNPPRSEEIPPVRNFLYPRGGTAANMFV